MLLRDSAQMLNSVSFVSDNCLQSVRHQTDEILHSGHRKWSPRFPKTMFECCQCLQLWAGINSCNHNAPNVSSRRKIWQILRPVLWWNVLFFDQVIMAFDVCTRASSCGYQLFLVEIEIFLSAKLEVELILTIARRETALQRGSVLGGSWMMPWISNRATPCNCCIILKPESYTNAI